MKSATQQKLNAYSIVGLTKKFSKDLYDYNVQLLANLVLLIF